MFNSARLKLTIWYLVISMLISLAFSTVIYKMLTYELDRFARAQRFKIERDLFRPDAPVTLTPGREPQRILFSQPIIDESLVIETRRRLLFRLFLLNAGIAITAGGLGYFLAGRTLKPIQTMVDDQNRFISDSSHELRTPLTSLKSALEVSLRDNKLTLKQAKTLISESVEEVNTLQALTDGMLQLAQYDGSLQPQYHTELEISDVVKSALKQIKPQADQKHIAIHTQLMPATVKGDASKLCEVVVILLDNAIKYSQPHQNITIAVSLKNKNAFIEVTDHGMGIEAKNISQIFDRFYRADTARTKRDTKGYGLGLSIAKKIIETHHGHITVKSKPNQKTVFTIKLPTA